MLPKHVWPPKLAPHRAIREATCTAAEGVAEREELANVPVELSEDVVEVEDERVEVVEVRVVEDEMEDEEGLPLQVPY